MNHKYAQCDSCANRSGWISMLTSSVLAVTKLYIGYVGGSKGCIADAIHSSACIVSSITIFLARNFVKRNANEKYSYGYGKIEFVAAAVVSFIILVIVTIFVVTSIKALFAEHHTVPHLATAVIAIVSIVANELLFRFLRCVGTEFSSPTIMANAWANRSDCFSSLAVLIGIVGTWLGIKHLDPLMALAVTLIIYKVVGSNLLHAIKGLMDHSVGNKLESDIKILLKEISEVRDVTNIKTRSLGHRTKVDITVNVDAKLTVSDTEILEKRICDLIHRKEESVGDIVINFESVLGGAS